MQLKYRGTSYQYSEINLDVEETTIMASFRGRCYNLTRPKPEDQCLASSLAPFSVASPIDFIQLRQYNLMRIFMPLRLIQK